MTETDATTAASPTGRHGGGDAGGLSVAELIARSRARLAGDVAERPSPARARRDRRRAGDRGVAELGRGRRRRTRGRSGTSTVVDADRCTLPVSA